MGRNIGSEIKDRIKQLILYTNPYNISRDVKKVAKKGYKESLKQKKRKIEYQEDYPVDFVVTWVNGSDPKWQNERAKYQPKDNSFNSEDNPARYRYWDNLQYWFRAVEQCAPWVRYIFFVTWGHIPSWLDTSNPKLKIIKHTDYIPSEYLPTFNSNVIELNFWRIPELSEHFVYFNDDVFLTFPVKKSDFFCNGFPSLNAISKPIKYKLEMASWDFSRFNNCRACNSKFDLKKVISKHPEKWFSYKYGKRIKYNLRTLEDGYLAGMNYPHTTFAFRKKQLEACFRQFQDEFELTFSHRFRNNQDLNLHIFDMWEMMHNTFEPSDNIGISLNLPFFIFERVKISLNDSSIKCVCLNDGVGIEDSDFDGIKTSVNNLLNEKFPQKSSFEL